MVCQRLTACFQVGNQDRLCAGLFQLAGSVDLVANADDNQIGSTFQGLDVSFFSVLSWLAGADLVRCLHFTGDIWGGWHMRKIMLNNPV